MRNTYGEASVKRILKLSFTLKLYSFFNTSSNPSLKLQYLIDPVSKFGDPRVDAGLVGFRTADAPGYHSAENEPVVSLPLHHHWTTAVACGENSLFG